MAARLAPRKRGKHLNAFIDSSRGLGIILALMAMRPTRPPRKRGPILYRQQHCPLNLFEDAAIHPVQPSQQAFGAREPDLRDDCGERFAFVLE
jgi:hypothetical protein